MSPVEIERIVHAGVPLARLWKIEVLEAAGGCALCRLPPDPGLLRPGGSISGPALMGLADVAMWAALLGLSGGRDESLTSQLAITFLRRPLPGPMLAEARIVKRGGRLIYGEVWLRSEGADEPAAHVTTQWVAVTPPTR
jgi:acyl-coenzyme A thioesterase PaaI-like protein